MRVEFLVFCLAGVAAHGSTIPLRIFQMAPHNSSADWVIYTSTLAAIGFKHETFDDERALAFFEEYFPGTELLSVYRGCARSLRSDLFRLAAVSKFGGFYMTMDSAARWPLEELAAHSAVTFPKEWKDDAAFTSRHFRPPRDELELWQVGNSAFGAAAGHQFVLDALEEALRRCTALLAAKNASKITDIDVLRSAGSYMLYEVYRDGRLAGKYGDVDFITGDDDKPLRDKFGQSPAPSSASPAPTSSSLAMTKTRFTTEGLLSERRLDESAEVCFEAALFDSWGDGWNDAFYTISSSSSGTQHTGTLASGSSGADVVCVDNAPACYSIEVSAGSYPDEVSWTIGGGALAGGAPLVSTEFWVLVGSELVVQSCDDDPSPPVMSPTLYPTDSPAPTHAPTMSPTTSPAPSAAPIISPTVSPAGSYETLLGFIEGGITKIHAAASTTMVFDDEITLESSSDVEIIGENTVFDGAGPSVASRRAVPSRLFVVDGGRLTLRSLELRNGYTTGNGGALSLLNGAFVEIINCVVSNSSAVNGGGVTVDSGSVLVMIGSSVIGNHASRVKCLRHCRRSVRI